MQNRRSFGTIRTLGVLAIATALTSVSTHAQLGPNLITNGGFEQPISDNVLGNPPATWRAGSNLSGWSITADAITLFRSGVSGTIQVGQGNAYEGLQYIDLNGDVTAPGVGSIQQTVQIAETGLYRLAFAMSGNTGQDGTILPNAPRSMRVGISDGSASVYSQNFTWNPANHPNHRGYGNDNALSWDFYEVDIVLNAGSYTLSFTSLFTQDDIYGPALDDVQLRLVPEPASMAVLACGMAGLLVMRRRRD